MITPPVYENVDKCLEQQSPFFQKRTGTPVRSWEIRLTYAMALLSPVLARSIELKSGYYEGQFIQWIFSSSRKPSTMWALCRFAFLSINMKSDLTASRITSYRLQMSYAQKALHSVLCASVTTSNRKIWLLGNRRHQSWSQQE